MADLGTIVGASPLDADDTTYFTSNNQPAVQTTTVALGNTPSDFGNMDTGLLYQLIARLRDAPPGADFDTYTIEWCIVNAAQDTVLAGASTTYANRFEGPTTITADSDQTIGSPTAFTITNTTASKSDWDNALIELRFNTSAQDMSPDNNAIQADYFQITGTYTVASGEVTSSASPAVAITNISGTDTLPVTYVYTINTGTQGVINNVGYAPDNVEVVAPGGGEKNITQSAEGIVNVLGYAPTVQLTKEAAPNNGVINVQGYAPAVTLTRNAEPSQGVINAQGYVSEVDITKEAAPNQGVINVQGYAPTVQLTRNVEPSQGVVNVQGYAASDVQAIEGGAYLPDNGVINVAGTDTLPVTYVYTINTGNQGVINVQGYIPGVEKNVNTRSPGTGFINIQGYQPTITQTTDFAVGIINVVGYQPTVETDEGNQPGIINVQGISPGPTTYVYTINTGTQGVVNAQGYVPEVDKASTFPTPDNGVINVVGYIPNVTFDTTEYPAKGLVEVVGYAPTVTVSPVRTTPSQGVINVVGQSPTISRGEINIEPAVGASP